MTYPELPDKLQVYAWPLPGVKGPPAGGLYATSHWLPFIGPTAHLLSAVLARDIMEARATSRKPLEVDTETLCLRLGVQRKALARAVARLGWHALARWAGEPGASPLEIRMMLPPLPKRLTEKLPKV